MLDKIKENMQYDQQILKKDTGLSDKTRGESFNNG